MSSMHSTVQLSKQQILIARPNQMDKEYQKLIQDAEYTNQQIQNSIRSISQNEIQDIYYLLKPNQIIYDSICGLCCLVAGLDKLSNEFLFMKKIDWFTVQGYFCKNYDQIINQIQKLQSSIVKKRLNPINLKKAQKHLKQIQGNQIECRLMNLLTQSHTFCKQIQEIERMHQIFDNKVKIPPNTQTLEIQELDVQNYFAEQKKPFFFNHDSDDEQTNQKVSMIEPQQLESTPPKQTKSKKKSYVSFHSKPHLFDNSGYKTILKNSPEYYSKTSQKQQELNKSYLSTNFGERHKYTPSIQRKEICIRTNKSTTPKKVSQFKDESPAQTQSTDMNSLNKIIDQANQDGNPNYEQIERMIQQELAQTKKMINKLEAKNKRLFWEETKSVKMNSQLQSSKISEEEYYFSRKDHQESQDYQNQRKKQIRQQDLSNSAFKISLLSPRSQFSTNKDNDDDAIKMRELRNMQKLLEQHIKQKEQLEKEHERLYNQVYQNI
ncbi:hypothetical protein pb186bvf_018612 [Paramecium bursaria]